MADNIGTTWTTYDANKMTSREIYGRVLAELGEKIRKSLELPLTLQTPQTLVYLEINSLIDYLTLVLQNKTYLV